MSIEALQVQNVRNICSATLWLHPRLNLIWGANGAGKTSLLEALHLLGRGRSFRTRRTERLIRQDQEGLAVVGRTGGAIGHTIGFTCTRETGAQARIDGQPVSSFADLTVASPTQSIDPSVHRLVEGGALGRRQWLDWTVFHVEPAFIDAWSRYRRALKQRNAALRAASPAAGSWDPELAATGELLSAARSRTLESMRPLWQAISERMVPIPIELSFYRGWSRELELAESLRLARPRDALRGVTSTGAHRADVQLRSQGRAASEVLSRGQQKLVGMSLVLAQLGFVQSIAQQPILLLLDDAAAELDPLSLARFKAELEQLSVQQVWTGLGPDAVPLGTGGRAFHVEQGALQTL